MTNGVGGGNICKLSDERPLRGREGAAKPKKLEKRGKKLLTSYGFCDRLNEFTAAS